MPLQSCDWTNIRDYRERMRRRELGIAMRSCMLKCVLASKISEIFQLLDTVRLGSDEEPLGIGNLPISMKNPSRRD